MVQVATVVSAGSRCPLLYPGWGGGLWREKLFMQLYFSVGQGETTLTGRCQFLGHGKPTLYKRCQCPIP